jgi:hypothetical protein
MVVMALDISIMAVSLQIPLSMLRGAVVEAQTCFKGQPPPACPSFLVAEFGVLRAFENELAHGQVTASFWEVGLMRHVGDGRRALGGSLYLTYDDANWRNVLVGVKARGRLWLHRRISLDVGAGILIANELGWDGADSGIEIDLPGFTGRVDLGVADWFGVTVGFDSYRVQLPMGIVEPGTSRLRDEQSSWFFGLKCGSYLGALGGVVAAALIHAANVMGHT